MKGQLTLWKHKLEPIRCQWGNITYGSWCVLEANRIGISAKVRRKGKFICIFEAGYEQKTKRSRKKPDGTTPKGKGT